MRTAGKSLAQVAVISLLAVLIGLGCRSTSTSDQASKKTKADKAAAQSVQKALDTDPVFKYPDVSVRAQPGAVELSGFVSTQEQRNRAEELATGASRGTRVINQIQLSPSPTGRATIVDPLGRETGRVMLDTNAPAPVQPHADH